LSVVAPDVIALVYGPKWSPTVPLLQILAYAGILRAFTSGAQYLFVALGQPRVSARLAAIRATVLIPLVIVGAGLGGAVGAAWAMLAAAAAISITNAYFVARALELQPATLLGATYRSVIAGVVMLAVMRGMDAALPVAVGIGRSVHLLCLTLTGAGTYAGTLMVAWALAGKPNGAERQVLDAIRSFRRSSDRNAPVRTMDRGTASPAGPRASTPRWRAREP
jgi:O-antigen/teichoic acid export membrane protein